MSRREELRDMMLKMGESLIKEGDSTSDDVITQAGTFMYILSTLLNNEEDMYAFSEICSIFSIKKILESIDDVGKFSPDMMMRMIREFIKPKDK